jgi:hypothetical protein
MSDAPQQQLSDEDLERVERVTSSGIHSVSRKPFRPLVLLAVILGVTVTLTVVSILLERFALG